MSSCIPYPNSSLYCLLHLFKGYRSMSSTSTPIRDSGPITMPNKIKEFLKRSAMPFSRPTSPDPGSAEDATPPSATRTLALPVSPDFGPSPTSPGPTNDGGPPTSAPFPVVRVLPPSPVIQGFGTASVVQSPPKDTLGGRQHHVCSYNGRDGLGDHGQAQHRRRNRSRSRSRNSSSSSSSYDWEWDREYSSFPNREDQLRITPGFQSSIQVISDSRRKAREESDVQGDLGVEGCDSGDYQSRLNPSRSLKKGSNRSDDSTTRHRQSSSWHHGERRRRVVNITCAGNECISNIGNSYIY